MQTRFSVQLAFAKFLSKMKGKSLIQCQYHGYSTPSKISLSIPLFYQSTPLFYHSIPLFYHQPLSHNAFVVPRNLCHTPQIPLFPKPESGNQSPGCPTPQPAGALAVNQTVLHVFPSTRLQIIKQL